MPTTHSDGTVTTDATQESRYSVTLTPPDEGFAQRMLDWYIGDQGHDPQQALACVAADHAVAWAQYEARKDIAEDLIRTMESKRSLVRHYTLEAMDRDADKHERASSESCARQYGSEVFGLEKFAKNHGVNVGW